MADRDTELSEFNPTSLHDLRRLEERVPVPAWLIARDEAGMIVSVVPATPERLAEIDADARAYLDALDE